MRSLRNARGMTLIEIMIVLAIIAIIAGFLGRGVFNRFASAKAKATQLQMKEIENAIEAFNLDVGSYPKDLLSLIQKPAGARNYSPKGYLGGAKALKDPFGCEFEYKVPGSNGREYDIFSWGNKECTDKGTTIYSLDAEPEAE